MPTAVARVRTHATADARTRNALERVDEEWDESFTAQIVTLESAGVATDEQMATMGAIYGTVISRALDGLESLVTSQLPSDAALEEEGDD